MGHEGEAEIEQDKRHGAAPQCETQRCKQTASGQNIGKKQLEPMARHMGKNGQKRELDPEETDRREGDPAGLKKAKQHTHF
ncbi:hypothetical protein [Breoghania sp. JC706]|uniref:hypothetical protein n=1 Tax=Breoghania sp. JC706 TaxID=3117732 RepID=UPI00300BA9A5